MDYKDALDQLREQLFTEPVKKEKPVSNGFIPQRAAPSALIKSDAPKRTVEWVRQIKQAAQEIRAKYKDAEPVYSEPIIPESKPTTTEEQAAPLIARRGDRPSSFAPDKPITPVNFKGDWENVAQAIKDIESSGGDYSARGPVVTSGQYKGESALGAYQIMPGNLPSWSKAALGREVSEEEFLSSPEIQDAIFLDRMKKAAAKYGTVDDAVSVWFSGVPVSRAGGTSDGYTTGPEYIRSFQRNYNMYSSSVR